MYIFFIFAMIVSFFIGIPSGQARAEMDIGISIGEEGIKRFHLMIGDYYQVPYREVVVIRERHIPDDEIPVVFFIARRARVRPATIIDLRLHGDSWMGIILHFHLSPEIFYVPVKVVEGPPYGRAYGYYKNRPRKEWRKIRLEDDDVINLVNLRVMSEYYGRPPEDIMRMRGGGRSFTVINDEVKKEGKGERKREFEGREGGKHKGKGKRDH